MMPSSGAGANLAMTRAAIYARYSSDRQNALSIADQVLVCMRHAQAQGWELAATFSDAAISGAAMANRPGLLSALDAADRGEFDVLLTEDEDRVARNLEHLAHCVNRLRRAGCFLTTLSTGRVETMHVAFKGLIAEDFLRSLSAKTKRGVRANAERGRATGGRLFGYRTRPGGDIEIAEEEADVIRRIFAAYVAGGTARSIAASLNLAGVPGPRGGRWNASSINGSRQRGYGILQTEIYAGVKVWNRVDKQKDTITGGRLDVTRPKEEWKRTPVPHLRIVDEETWTATRARKEAEGASRPHELRRRPGIFSGLLKCGMCGYSYTVVSSNRLACSGHREKGDAVCANRRTLQRQEVEERILAGLQTRLLAPDLVATWVRAYHERWRERRAEKSGRREQLEKRLAEIARSELRTIEAIERGTATPVMEARMMEREAERKVLAAELEVLQAEREPPIELHPRIAEAYAEQIGRLAKLLEEAAAGQLTGHRELVDLARGFVDRIEIKPILQRPGSPYDVTLYGQLAALLRPEPEHAQNGLMVKVVAGGGIEPPT